MIYHDQKPHNESGQGLVTYAFIIALVAVVTIGSLALVGPALTRPYFEIACGMQYGGKAEVEIRDIGGTEHLLCIDMEDGTIYGDYDSGSRQVQWAAND